MKKLSLHKSLIGSLIIGQLLLPHNLVAQNATQQVDPNKQVVPSEEQNLDFTSSSALIFLQSFKYLDANVYAEEINRITNSDLTLEEKKKQINTIKQQVSVLKSMGIEDLKKTVDSDIVENELKGEIETRIKELQEEARLKGKDISWIEKELNRYRLRSTFDAKGKLISDNASYQLAYQLVVEPSLRTGEQIRRDVYYINLALAPKIYKDFFGRAYGQIRLTFSRYFSTDPTVKNEDGYYKNFLSYAKAQALFKKPKPFWDVPFSVKDINKKMDSGETVRIEVLGGLGVGINNSDSYDDFRTGVALNYDTNALFMTDIYKHNDNLIRTRFVGLKNRGVISLNAYAKTDFDIFSALNSALEFSASFGKSISLSPRDQYPVETLMVDMNFNLASSLNRTQPVKSSELLDDLLQNIKRGKFVVLFQPQAKSGEVRESLRELLEPSQDVALADRNKALEGEILPHDYRVKTNFKGSVRSTIDNTYGKVKTSKFLAETERNTGATSHIITSYTADDQPRFFILENSYDRKELKVFFGRNEVRLLNDTDILFEADYDQKTDDVKVRALTDVSVKTEMRSKDFDKDDIKEIKKSLYLSLPQFMLPVAQPVLDRVIPEMGLGSGTISYQFNFGQLALLAMRNTPFQDINAPLSAYLSSQTDKYRKTLVPPHHQEGIAAASYPNFVEYVEERANDLSYIFSSKVGVNEKYNLFKDKLKYDLLFQQQILGEYVASKLPQTFIDDSGQAHDTSELLSLRLYSSTRKNGSRLETVGNQKYSEVYRATSFLRSVINDRSYDLRFDETILDDDIDSIDLPNNYKVKDRFAPNK